MFILFLLLSSQQQSQGGEASVDGIVCYSTEESSSRVFCIACL